MTQVADMVLPGRCGCCGHKLIQWSPQAIVDAAHTWNDTYGVAPKQRDWAQGTPDHPALTAVYNTFGTWPRFLAAAGLDPARRQPSRLWSQELIAEAMLNWLLRTGQWPTSGSWHSAGPGHPSNRTVYDYFPSWNAAKEYAGWVAECRHCGSALRAGQTIWCCDECRRSYRHKPLEEPRTCSGCGGELDNRTLGCGPCTDRVNKRALRANKSAPAAHVDGIEPPSRRTGSPARGFSTTTTTDGEAKKPAAERRAA